MIVKTVAQQTFITNSTAGMAGLNQAHWRTSTSMLGPSHRARAISSAVDSTRENRSWYSRLPDHLLPSLHIAEHVCSCL